MGPVGSAKLPNVDTKLTRRFVLSEKKLSVGKVFVTLKQRDLRLFYGIALSIPKPK